jgi:polyphosphate kinase
LQLTQSQTAGEYSPIRSPRNNQKVNFGNISERFLNRELSWLDFNERVLTLAEDPSVPILERAKFAAIFSSNLDEFYQVRVAALIDQVEAGVSKSTYDGRTPSGQLEEIYIRVSHLVARQESLVADVLLPELQDQGIEIVRWDHLTFDQRDKLSQQFFDQIFPILTPLAVDPAHPFPYISNLALSIGALVVDPKTGEQKFSRVKVPNRLERLIRVEDSQFISIEEVIGAHLNSLYRGMSIKSWFAFRVTRNADLDLEDEEAEDLLAAVEMELRRRRFGQAIRLEVDAQIPSEALELLKDELELSDSGITRHSLPLDLTMLSGLLAVDRPDLKDPSWPAVVAGRLSSADETDASFFSVIRDRDILVHHPYESFVSSTEEFIAQAADDPKVQSIKMTLYRTSVDSPIARSLIRAAERGVQVVVLVELKARFDEATNVGWAKEFERAGVHVVYGLVGLKTHSKCVLVVRSEDDGTRRYVHIGTGNYNSKTARIYEDIGFFSCDSVIGSDVAQLFNHLTGFSRGEYYEKLVVAPEHLRAQILELISNEADYGTAGAIAMKINALADPEIVEALYAASNAGVKIDLIVRGICCLVPGVSGMSENIRVRSILGRYLEHSRIYRFANGRAPADPEYLIGSADMMPRNLDLRVEVLAPVEHKKHRAWLETVFTTHLRDDVSRFELGSDGTWSHQTVENKGLDVQKLMYDWISESQVRKSRSS